MTERIFHTFYEILKEYFPDFYEEKIRLKESEDGKLISVIDLVPLPLEEVLKRQKELSDKCFPV